MDSVITRSRSWAAGGAGRFYLCYLLPPWFGCAVLLATVKTTSLVVSLVAVSLVLGWTQIINYCGLAHTCALTRSVRSRADATRWLKPVAAYTLGGCVSAVVTGAMLGYLGRLVASSIPEDLATTLMVAIATVVACRELGLLRFRIPELRRQTRARWFTNRPLLNPACWGFDVGFAFLTWQVMSGAYFLASVALLSASPVLGVVIFVCYWLGRAAPHWLEPFFLPNPSEAYTFVGHIYSLRKPLAAAHAFAVAVAVTPFLIAH